MVSISLRDVRSSFNALDWGRWKLICRSGRGGADTGEKGSVLRYCSFLSDELRVILPLSEVNARQG